MEGGGQVSGVICEVLGMWVCLIDRRQCHLLSPNIV